MRRTRGQAGFTMIEMVIATFVAFIVLLAFARIILANQRAWEWGRDKTVLQQNTTEALEWMARWIRSSRTVEVISATEFRTYNEDSSRVHTFRRLPGDNPRLQEDRGDGNGWVDLVDRKCISFAVTTDEDSTSLGLTLELEDKAGNRVAASTRAALRNRKYTFGGEP